MDCDPLVGVDSVLLVRLELLGLPGLPLLGVMDRATIDTGLMEALDGLVGGSCKVGVVKGVVNMLGSLTITQTQTHSPIEFF